MTSKKETRKIVEAGLARRRRKERLFQGVGLLATTVGVVFLGVFFASLIGDGASAFRQTFMQLDVELSEDDLVVDGELDLQYADFDGLVRASLRGLFPEVKGRSDRRALYKLLSNGAGYQIRDMLVDDPGLVGTAVSIWVPAASNVDMLIKGNIDANLDETLRPISDKQIEWITALQEGGRLETRFNKALFTNGDSRDPELAGIRGAVMGSFYMLLVTVLLSFPIGVAAAI